MWPLLLLLLLCFSYLQPVLLQEENSLILQGGRDPCEGYVHFYHDAEWGLVGNTDWGNKTEEVVCSSISCGKPVQSIEILKPANSFVRLNEVKCKGNETDLWNCWKSGWKISEAPDLFVRNITCSNRITIALDRFRCSGYVQYSTDGTAPSNYFCGEEWGDDEKRVVCKSLGCGEPINYDPFEPILKGQSKKMKAKCVGEMSNLWQCVKGEVFCDKPAFVTCDDHDILRLKGDPLNVCSGQLEMMKNNEWTHDMNNSKSTDPHEWCKKMFCGDAVRTQTDGINTNLTCSDKVNIVLRDKNVERDCYGSVHIKMNTSFFPVCASNALWSQANGDVVCKEKNCGAAIDISRKPASQGIMDMVRCDGSEASLWHCSAKHNDQPFKCSSEPYVICAASVKVRLNDGPGRCAGRVEIFFEGEWKKVMYKKDTQWPENNAKTICRQLKCGGVRSRTEKFSNAMGMNSMTKTVTCTTEQDNIAKCNLRETYRNSGDDEEVGLVCEHHKVFYVDDNSCSGLVQVQHGERNYYLSGSEEMWNNKTATEVCKQMHCGSLTDFSSADVNTTSSIWHPKSTCPYKINPLLDCGKSTSDNGTSTVARVICSGSKIMNLTKGCWGNVNICVGDDCGGVCDESWTVDKSKILCQKLECGSHAIQPTNPVRNYPVLFKSVHMSTEQNGNLSACSFVKQESKCDSAYVVCSGSLKPQWKSSDYCSGKVEVEYEDKSRPVCGNALQDTRTQTLLCEKLGCGATVQSVDYYRSVSNAISTMTCENPTSHENLIECEASVEGKPCTYHGLRCSNWRRMGLIKGGACSGLVVVHSEGQKMASVSSHEWSREEGQTLCTDLKCGPLIRTGSENPIMGIDFWNATFNCKGSKEVQNIWDCAKEGLPSEKKQAYINCTGEPEVKLDKDHHGKLTINNMYVCDTSWTDSFSHKVCQHLGYSNAIPGNINNPKPEIGKDYFHIRCDETHVKIGQCSRVEGPCSGGLVSIYCTKNVGFKSTEKCGGQIEVIYTTENVGKVCYDTILSQKHKEYICKMLGCDDPIVKPKGAKPPATAEEIKEWVTVLKCNGNEEYPEYCLSRQSCNKKTPAEIYCGGYQPPDPPPPPPREVNILAIILGVGLSLILLIIIVIFVRIYIIRKNKNVKNFLPGFAMGNDVEFDSGEFEEINGKEMDDVKGSGIRSESEFVTENDARSTNSLPYDDIDEVSEVQPLTSRPPTIDPHDTDIQDNLEQNAKEDGVTYEVDDPQENYDDIEADPELTQTTAEVHDSSRNTPERSTNTPPDLVLGDDDYLVPGQDE